jgi:quercetin dioxygenase-like cupin family protein
MNSTYTFIDDLLKQIPEIPTDSIISRTLHNDDEVKVVLFGFAAGQELSEHTAAMPAMLYFVQGEAGLMLGEDTLAAQTGTWAHMPPHLSHSIVAKTPVVMLLLLLKTPSPEE